MKEWERDSRNYRMIEHTTELPIKHILPKANEIVKTAEQVIKTIYPFDQVPSLPSRYFDLPFRQTMYQQTSKNNTSKFTSKRNSVVSHFQQGSIIYDKFNTSSKVKRYSLNIFSIDKLKSLTKSDFLINVDKTSPISSPTDPLQFDSRFQSGNLSAVARCDGIYCLLLHNDVNTNGYTNWFYFSVISQISTKAKLAIMNYGKAGWAMNNFPGICVWRQGDNQWRRQSLNVQCQSNSNLYSKSQQYYNCNTLSFQFQFTPNQKTFFAYNVPYTYTDLLNQLDLIDESGFPYFHRKLAGTSLIGNRLELLTITNFQKTRNTEVELPVIVLMARTHAGETVSSWIMHNLIRFLVGNSQQAVLLRDNFIFKIFPMLNPDGVIHGNYRCSLIGRDLNRRWKNPVKQYYPEVYFVKNQIMDTFQKKQIKMVLDLHGHTQKRKAFFYGCTDRSVPHRTRLFPFLTSKLSTHFQFSSSNFSMQKSKESTARITLYNLIKSPDIFTIETSQFGINDAFLSTISLQQIATTICRSIAKYYKLVSDCKGQLDEYEQEMLGNPLLMRMGGDPSDGSDSQPSACNINFDKINKMSENVSVRPNTNCSSVNKNIVRPQSYKKYSASNTKNQHIFYTHKSREINQHISPSVPLRGSTATTQRREAVKPNIRTPKLQFIKDIESNTKLKQITVDIQKKPVRMINFQLLIDQQGRRKSSLRGEGTQSMDFRVNHSNYHMFQKRCMFRNRSYNWNKNSV